MRNTRSERNVTKRGHIRRRIGEQKVKAIEGQHRRTNQVRSITRVGMGREDAKDIANRAKIIEREDMEKVIHRETYSGIKSGIERRDIAGGGRRKGVREHNSLRCERSWDLICQIGNRSPVRPIRRYVRGIETRGKSGSHRRKENGHEESRWAVGSVRA